VELANLRGRFSEKSLENSEFQQKEKEKSRALFNEMVRLGETAQKQQQMIENQGVQSQAKMQQLEFQLKSANSQIQAFLERGGNNFNNLNLSYDKFSQKMLSLEQQLIFLSNVLEKTRN
jgi:hypothetical protein